MNQAETNLALGESRIRLQWLSAALDNGGADLHKHFCEIYDHQTPDRLYLLQQKTTYASIHLTFKTEEVGRVLRHINIFNRFTFTLVPTEVEEEVYRQIYEFFFFSRLSETYISWFSSLLLRFRRPISENTVNGRAAEFRSCGTCPLQAKNCSKGALSVFILNPFVDSTDERRMDAFCEIERKYVTRLANDLLESMPDLESFEKARASIGIRSQFWIDPFGLF